MMLLSPASAFEPPLARSLLRVTLLSIAHNGFVVVVVVCVFLFSATL